MICLSNLFDSTIDTLAIDYKDKIQYITLIRLGSNSSTQINLTVLQAPIPLKSGVDLLTLLGWVDIQLGLRFSTRRCHKTHQNRFTSTLV